jgi:beta-lactamase regulating signal transducer with metallopeptidase domain
MTLTLLVVAWLLTYLLHSTILLGGAWLLTATRIVRSPVVKDTLWKVCLVGGLVTATVYSLSPYQPYSVHVLLPGVTRSQLGAGAPRTEGPAAAVSGATGVRSWGSEAASDVGLSRGFRTAAAPPESPTPSPQSPSSPWPYLVLGAWLLGAVLFLARAGYCRLRLVRQLGARREIAGGPLVAMLETLQAGAGARRPIRLTASRELAGPVALGGGEICLPERALTALSPAEHRAVLAHELGHLVRRDPLWLGLSVACESLFFFQPLNVVARRKVQEAAEYLCDDWAVHQTGGSLTLAKCLAEVATWIEASPRAAPVAGMASNRSLLVERVHRLLDGVPPTARRVWWAAPAAALALSSVAFAAPGVSPPCEQGQGAVGAAAPASRSRASAASQGEPQTWATIRDAHVIAFRRGFAPQLTGQGHLGIRRGGRAIELGEGQRLLVNGREPRDDQVVEVCETDRVEIVGADGRLLWRLEPVRVESGASAWAGAERSSGRAEARAAAEGSWSREWPDSQGKVWTGGARALGADRGDMLDERLDRVDDAIVALDTADFEAVSQAALVVRDQVARAVDVQVVPALVRAQGAIVQVATDLVPALVEAGTRVATDVVPAIVQGLCDGGLCGDSSSAPVRRGKVLRKHRP